MAACDFVLKVGSMDNWYFILELVGTAAFAVSGAVTAVTMKMDLFGAAILGMTTACGGGIIGWCSKTIKRVM